MMSAHADDLFAEDIISDPYTYYGLLRESEPVLWNTRHRVWVVTRYVDVVWLLRHPELASSRNDADDPTPPSPAVDDRDADELKFVRGVRATEFIQNDPPEHARMRLALSRFFTPTRMEDWRELVRTTVDGCLNDLVGQGEFDVCSDLAWRLPLTIIFDLMGVPPEQRTALKEQADRRMQSALSLDARRMRTAASGIRDTADQLGRLIDNGLEPDAWTLLSILKAAEERGTYSRDEVLSNAGLLIDAGHETTIQLISNGVLAFMRNPEQWERFRENPRALAATATEECLRFDPPLPEMRRIAATDFERGGQQIHKGDRIRLSIAAANRDPRVFVDPDRFDITRHPNKHVAFASGIHVCLGQFLARMEGQEVFTALAERVPDLQLASQRVTYAKIRGARSLTSLDVTGRVSA